MLKRVILGLLALSLFVVSYHLRQQRSVSGGGADATIVCMAPSSGEVVFALGLGDQVVGVSSFAKYPKEALAKPKVGGYLDVDLEAIVRLKPQVVVLLKEQADLAEQIEGLGMGTLLVDHMSVEGILDSITKVGERFDRVDEAGSMRKELEAAVRSARALGSSGKRVLMSIGREHGSGKIKGVVAAGAGGYHQELLDIAGFTNAYEGEENFPQLSREHLVRMNPDIIIDMVNQEDADRIGVEKLLSEWQSNDTLDAVRNGRVYLLVGDKHFVPGPRFIDTLEWLLELRKQGGGGV
ncbi:ABC transporter substrate-binding protein [Rubritalea tangerina]|uniref:ABC transporter substrate-binding protein n=2 Tax=Rubritalea tangerina TaxID=430798 RepID=A0ABW4Z8G8_9BACT